MTDQESIKKQILLKGGRLNYSELDERIKESYTLVKYRAEKAIESFTKKLPNIKQISFDVIDDYGFNAFATGRNHNYFIGINRGTVATLSLIFDRLLADKEVLKYIGDIEKETDDLPLLNITANYQATTDMLLQFSPPQCPVRFAFSYHMTRMACDFILAHEIGHIISGHLSFGQNQSNGILDESLSMIDESQVEKNMLSKTMEMDADTWATTILLTSEINRIVEKNPLSGKEWADFYSRPGQVLMLFAFVVSTISKLFGDSRLNTKTFKTDSYPKPRLRCFISLLAVKNNLDFIKLNKKTNYDLDKFGIPISVKAAFNSIETAFEIITGKKSSSQSIDDAWGEIGKNQYNQLVECWNEELMPNLKGKSYLRLFKKDKISTI